MAQITFAQPAPFGAITVHRFVGAVEAAIQTVFAWNESRKTRKELSLLSDEALADIGLARGDIASF